MATKRAASPAAGLPPLREAGAASSSGVAGDAAHLALAAGGAAIDAVVAGFFAAAGANAGVLLGSTAAIVGNTGSGVRAFDGRPVQPGKEAARPRGFVEGQAVPDAARVAAARTVPMMFLLHAYGGRTSLSTLAKHGADVAIGQGAKVRARVLRRVGAAGVIGLRTEGVHDALLAAANSVAGGALTEADLENVMPGDADARTLYQADGDVHVAGWPWSGEGASDLDVGWNVDVVVAADHWGGVAALSFAHQPKGVDLPGVELSAPRLAVPVRRGVTRIAPGTPLRAPGPVGIARFGRELSLAFGLSGAWQKGEKALFEGDLDAASLAPLAAGGAVESALAGLANAHGALRSVAAVRSPKATRTAVVLRGGG